PPLLPALTERLAAARPQLLAAQEALRRAEAARSRLAAAARSPGMQAPLRRVDALLPLARDGLELALAAPDLLGADGTRTYLVLLQDSNELRATGGFIGAVAEVTLDRGRLAVTFDDSEGIDDLAGHPYPEPPAPLQHYMGVDLWLFRDANWSPDFPTSARTALRFYQLGRGRVAGGVIAVDERAVQELLRATGPVVIPGEAQPVSAERVVQYMRGQYNRGFPQRRKAFLGPLAQAIAARLQAPGVDLPRLAAVARRALDERHALVYLPDGPLAPLLARYGWDGAVRPPADDFLMVVSSNVGYNKVGPYIAEQWSYTVDLTQPAAPYAQLSVRQTHTRAGPADCGWVERRRAARYEDYFAGCFWNYLRVLVPAGSTLFDAATNPTPGAWLRTGRDEPGAVTVAPGEANTFALSTFLIVPRGGTRETVLRYHLPPQVLRHDGRTWRYGITVQKQPGRDALPLTVRVRLPPGATLSATSLPPQSVAAPWVSYRLDLRQDQRLELAFSP
ncbi:MAG TPA: DUF4012 domain-containing protein, partial [Roseiflexaceae bacterium]|nr:DUF4012 domain-containing protein [Roseiflexaceae bacterium]